MAGFYATVRYSVRRQLHQAAWSIGFLIYTVAALLEAYSEFTGGWDHTVYRVYIVLAAGLVGFLGLGVLYLIVRRKVFGHLFLLYNLIVIVVFLVGTFTHPLVEEKLVAGITVGGAALGESMTFPRVCSLFFNIPGTLFLLGGAVYSIIKFLPKREFAYRVWANVLVLLGTLIIAGAGSRARAGNTAGLYPAEMLGAAVLLWGFLKAGTLKRGAAAAREQRARDAS